MLLALFFSSVNTASLLIAIFSVSVTAPGSSLIIWRTIMNMSVASLFTFLACADWKTVAVFVVLVADDAAGRIREEQRRIIYQMLHYSRRTSSLLTPVLSPVGSFLFCMITASVTCCVLRYPVLQVAIAAVGAQDGSVHSHTTCSGEAACSAPTCGQSAPNCSTV